MRDIESFDNQNPRFMDYIYILYRRRLLVIGLTACAWVIGFAVSLVVTKYYAAEVSFTSHSKAQGQSGGGVNVTPETAMLSTALAAAVGGTGGGNAFYISLIESRRIQDPIIDALQLVDYYKVKLKASARGLLRKNTVITELKGGIVKLRVMDQKPEMAQQIAGAYVKEINAFLQSLTLTENQKYAVFLEDRIKVAAKELEKTYLERESTVKETLYIALLKEYEIARANAAKERMDVQVVDEAEALPGPVVPNQRTYTMVSAAMGFLVSLFLIVAEQWWRSIMADSRNAFLLKKMTLRKPSVAASE
jgi:uncharacterized protein involved in exopolysaccharide biosynthesis